MAYSCCFGLWGNLDFRDFSAIWTKKLLPQALKGCPKYNKLPNLVTLDQMSARFLDAAKVVVQSK